MAFRSVAAVSLGVALGAVPASAQVVETSFLSGSSELKAYLHHDSTTESRALAIYLHGNPGGPIEQSSPIADALMSVGVDVLRFNYRGLWGNGGDFNLASALGDLDAALDFLTDAETTERYGLNHSNVILLGYSFGTATGLLGAARDDRVDAVISLAPCDHGYFANEWLTPDSDVRRFLVGVTEELFGENGPIDQDASVFLDDLTSNVDAYRFPARAEQLLEKKLLFLAGTEDVVCYVEDHFFPLYRQLKALNHGFVEAHVLDMDHGFTGVGMPALLELATAWIERSFPDPD